MKHTGIILAFCATLAACGDTNPFMPDEETTEEETTEEDVDGFGGDLDLPPGTTTPTADYSIVRYEAQGENNGGYVTTVTYNTGNDTLTIDNLPFDGDDPYARGTAVSSLGTQDVPASHAENQIGTHDDSITYASYSVYDGDLVVLDGYDNDLVDQLNPYRAIYGVSQAHGGADQGAVRFAIVRTGAYAGYGFGGWIYERNGSVTLPTSGQANYFGNYAGTRVFNGDGGLQFIQGKAELSIDFDDFNSGPAIQGIISDRELISSGGTAVVGLELPTIVFAIGEGVMNSAGEFTGSLTVNSGTLSGSYYGVLGGDNADVLVGIVVLEVPVDEANGFDTTPEDFSIESVQETGGFILYR